MDKVPTTEFPNERPRYDIKASDGETWLIN